LGPRLDLYAGQRVPHRGIGGDEDQVDRVEHQLDGHQHQDRVTPAEHAVDAQAEEQGGDDVRDDRVHHSSSLSGPGSALRPGNILLSSTR